MSDYGAIVSMLARIQHSVDHQDREGFGDCWTEDARLHIVMFDGATVDFIGREDLLIRVTGTWTGQASGLRHMIGGVDVRITGPDTATAAFYCSYINVGAEPALAGLGEYHDELVKGADGRWRVKLRRHAFLTPLSLRIS